MPPDPEGLVRIRRAFLTVSDVRGLAELAQGLARYSVELVATAGTGRALEAAGVPVRSAEQLTGIGSWFGGRLKTLHPGILGGVLAPRDVPGERELAERNLLPIDLVAVNFYPFGQRVVEAAASPDLVDAIDIGGVTLARAAAKNFAWVAVASDPGDYPELLRELREREGSLSASTRRALAVRTFSRTQRYDRQIEQVLGAPAHDSTSVFPSTVDFRRSEFALRYGENPHQRAAAYVPLDSTTGGLVPVPVELLQGPGLSYTNLVDLDTALALVAEFPTATAAVVKHATPCGVASGRDLREALERALATDPVARYGCAIAVNRPLGEADLGPLHGIFVDLLAAPEVEAAARSAASRRKKLKLVRAASPNLEQPAWELRSAVGRLLLQEADHRELAAGDFKAVTSHVATPQELCALDFAWRVVRHAKSNAVVLAQGSATVGIGSGQATRVKAVELAVEVAGKRAVGSVLASDAFFPFADGVEAAGRAGVRAIIQPGGSLRDLEVTAAAEKFGIAMYFTGWRVFRH